MERFPLELVREPTAVTNRDPRDVYNNIILFTVHDDGQRGGGGPTAEMHIFHVLGKPVSRPKYRHIFSRIVATPLGRAMHGLSSSFVLRNVKPVDVSGVDRCSH